MTIEHVAYVRHHDIPSYYELGWVISDFLDCTPHGQYSVIMEWRGRAGPVTPLQNQSDRHYADKGLPVEGGDFHAAVP